MKVISESMRVIKIIAVVLAVCFIVIALAACVDDTSGGQTPPNTADSEQPSGSDEQKEKTTEMYITVNGNKLKVTLEDNSSVAALAELLKQGDIVYTADDYGGFEKVGSIGHTLPRNDSQLTTQPGDVILYSGSNIVLFYGSNSWSYTRLGRINGYSVQELKTLLGAGDGSVQITLSLK